jgi:hypothetical protein
MASHGPLTLNTFDMIKHHPKFFTIISHGFFY